MVKDGIHFGGAIFIAPELTRIGGNTVEVRYMPHDLRSIEVFTQDGWLCTAYPQDQALASRPRGDRESAQDDAEKGELLKILGLADQLNKPIPPSAGELEA